MCLSAFGCQPLPARGLICGAATKALGFKLNILTGQRHKSSCSGLSHGGVSSEPLHCHVAAAMRTIIVNPLRLPLYAALATPLIKRRIWSRIYTWNAVCRTCNSHYTTRPLRAPRRHPDYTAPLSTALYPADKSYSESDSRFVRTITLMEYSTTTKIWV